MITKPDEIQLFFEKNGLTNLESSQGVFWKRDQKLFFFTHPVETKEALAVAQQVAERAQKRLGLKVPVQAKEVQVLKGSVVLVIGPHAHQIKSSDGVHGTGPGGENPPGGVPVLPPVGTDILRIIVFQNNFASITPRAKPILLSDTFKK